MNRLISILEEKLVPVAAWIEQNRYINGIRRAFIMLLNHSPHDRVSYF